MNQQMLRESADKIIGNYSYFRQLTDDERASKKDHMATTLIKLSALQDELAELKKEINEKIKPLNDELRATLRDIKLNGQEVTEEVYVHFDQEADRANYFNAEGEQIFSRRLYPDEKQTTMYKIINE